MAKRTMIGYLTYNFKEKDPIIDKLRTIIQDEKVSYMDIHNLSGVNTNTLYGWFNGATRKPQHATIMAVALALGYDYKLVKVGKIVPFRKKGAA